MRLIWFQQIQAQQKIMNYLQTPIYSQVQSPKSRQVKSFRKHFQYEPENQLSHYNQLNNCSKDLQASKVKSSHGNRLRPLIKINKNLQNAFPLNFFSSSKPSKSSPVKKSQILNKKCFQINLQPIPSFLSSFQTNHKPITKYQSIQLKKPTLIDSSIICQTLRSQRFEKFKIKPIQSLCSSIQKKQNISFSFEKNNEEVLPHTAQTLENTEQQELFTVTFGKGFTKNNTPKRSSVQLQRDDQKMAVQLKNKGSENKNAISLELKKSQERRSMNKSRQSSDTKKRILYEQRSGSMSQRRQINTKEVAERRRMISQQKEDNPFMKIRLDMQEIISKKTTIFPRVNSQQNKRQRVSKLEKIVC